MLKLRNKVLKYHIIFLEANNLMKTPLNLFPFNPHPFLKGGHRQTILGYYLPSPKHLRGTNVHHIKISGGDKLALCENRPNRKSTFQRAILFMHGLGGKAGSSYMLRIAHLFQNRGWITFRMNHRGCGEGIGLARQTYHSGRSEDASAAMIKIEELYPHSPLVTVGFSLSGNVLLKLLGEKKEPLAANLAGAIAVAPPINLSLCAAALCQSQNRVYDLRFMRLLKKAMKERREHFLDFPEFDFKWWMKLRDFDELCTASLNNFKSAEDYYSKCSAKQFLSEVSTPTYLLASDDDPFVPKESFDDLPENEFLDFNLTKSGGHMGYVSAEKTPLGTHRWLDYAVLAYAENLIKDREKLFFADKE